MYARPSPPAALIPTICAISSGRLLRADSGSPQRLITPSGSRIFELCVSGAVSVSPSLPGGTFPQAIEYALPDTMHLLGPLLARRLSHVFPWAICAVTCAHIHAFLVFHPTHSAAAVWDILLAQPELPRTTCATPLMQYSVINHLAMSVSRRPSVSSPFLLECMHMRLASILRWNVAVHLTQRAPSCIHPQTSRDTHFGIRDTHTLATQSSGLIPALALTLRAPRTPRHPEAWPLQAAADAGRLTSDPLRPFPLSSASARRPSYRRLFAFAVLYPWVASPASALIPAGAPRLPFDIKHQVSPMPILAAAAPASAS
ncbi:hypothetical protein EVG20_g9792 [Dentipellis fragilis]|uniref:Uncharacterized protein n=1 Tax=Dentipellis fragilis TaxID=205917 RepID=A0A4Y9XVX4_9AGAM|nr:hypothetical protein EVG20_g9792 [Dentipellis fragilis]